MLRRIPMMSDVLTEMCVLGGCAAHRAITEACKHCGNYRSEIERRRALPLTDGSDGLRFKCVSSDVRTLPAAEYKDKRGWRYKVMPGIGPSAFKTRCLRPDKADTDSWKCYAKLPWRNTFDEAQADLDGYASEKGRAKV